MGAFAYCEEDDTYAAVHYEDSVEQAEKQRRLDAVMAVQEEISLQHQEEKVGKTIRVIIDREDPDYYIGRTEFDSPEVDPEVLITKEKELEIGSFYDVRISEALPFELIATTVE